MFSVIHFVKINHLSTNVGLPPSFVYVIIFFGTFVLVDVLLCGTSSLDEESSAVSSSVFCSTTALSSSSASTDSGSCSY